MRDIFLFGVVCLFLCSLHGQGNSTIDELLKEAESVLYTQPKESIKISEYVLSTTQDKDKTIQANFLLAQSFYVMGQFNEAANYALEAKNNSNSIDDINLKLNIQLFATSLLRELGFKYLADIFVVEAASLKDRLKEDELSFFTAKLKQDQAAQDIRSGKYESATENLHQALTTFKEQQNLFSVNSVSLKLSEIFLITQNIDSSRFYSQQVLANLKSGVPNYYQQQIALNQMAQISFLEKDFLKAKSLYQKAYLVSEEISNIFYIDFSLQGLMTIYLALEDTEEYAQVKLKQNQTSAAIATDKTLAMNAVYNRIDQYEENKSKHLIQIQYSKIYGVGFILILILILGILYSYYLNIKNAQYRAILKYINPSKADADDKPIIPRLEKSSIVPEDIESQILEKLERFEKGTKFTKPEMSMALLASKLDTNTKYLSEVINRQKGKNFNAYINELRINYIIEKLRTEKIYSQYKISYLAEESGFSSHSSFATVFKSITGVSPTAFMALLKKQSA